MVRVKLCGLMSREDVQQAVAAGADALGFVTEYPTPLPWNLRRAKTAELVAETPPFITTTVVVGGAVEDILAIARKIKPHFLQLHGDETLLEVRTVCAALRGAGTRVLKALRIDADSGKARFSVTDPLRAGAMLADSGIAGLVIDSCTDACPLGAAVTLDWDLVRQVSARVHVPLILAGGLTIENIAEAIRRVRPYAVDVLRGVERASGVKDAELMRKLVKAAEGAA